MKNWICIGVGALLLAAPAQAQIGGPSLTVYASGIPNVGSVTVFGYNFNPGTHAVFLILPNGSERQLGTVAADRFQGQFEKTFSYQCTATEATAIGAAVGGVYSRSPNTGCKP